jgi:hypothetical protein
VAANAWPVSTGRFLPADNPPAMHEIASDEVERTDSIDRLDNDARVAAHSQFRV